MHQPRWKSPEWHLPPSIPVHNTFISSQCLAAGTEIGHRQPDCTKCRWEVIPPMLRVALALWAEVNV